MSPLPSLLCAVALLASAPTWASSWDEILGRYRACRAAVEEARARLVALAQEERALRRAAEGLEGEERDGLQAFLAALEEREASVRSGLDRIPPLLGELEGEIRKLRGTTDTCPECVEAGVGLLCATGGELHADAIGALAAVRDVRRGLSGGAVVEGVIEGEWARLRRVERGFEERGARGDAEEDLSAARASLDAAERARRAGQTTWPLAHALRARWSLRWLESYLAGPP